ncbi:MAG: aminomethyl-transferring glycine dehydrogenase subunit GcvPA [Candidatus Brocadiaceae bacterium]|nr:aminomethyl-transferring glycine dehydrogenase subunit GcvPA [Candidatus Brocadiaceae bacterium]
MPYISNTDEDRRRMLAAIDVESMEDLFADIPSELRARSFRLPAGRSEMDVRAHLRDLAEQNDTGLAVFLGGGFYDHYVPAAVDALLRRGELYTPYTPYQPEVSQGTLQAIYEYQTAICRLTGMEVANASLYDGGTALCEAVMMALRTTGRSRVVLAGGVNPIYRRMLAAYTRNLPVDLVDLPPHPGPTDRAAVRARLDGETAAVVLQNPDFFGGVDDLSDVVEAAHECGALALMGCYPVSLGLLKTPGEMGADIVTGEGQSLGLPLSFGGPYLGFMATRQRHVRQMPGRLVGRTADSRGRRGFVLTLQTREQHIRRERATSNICTNEALCALGSLIYLTLMGRQGLKDLARLCADKAAYARRRLDGVPGLRVVAGGPTFNEFVCELPENAAEVAGRMLEAGCAAGLPLGRYYDGMERLLLVAVTERRSKRQIDSLAQAFEEVL